MNEEVETKASASQQALGWILAPLSVLLALAATMIAGLDFDLTQNNMMPVIVTGVAGVLSYMPRLIRTNRPDFSPSLVSLGVLVVAFVGAELLYILVGVDAVVSALFAAVVLFGSLLSLSGRHEWQTMVVFSGVGFWIALSAAGDALAFLPSTYTMPNGQEVSTLNLERQAAAYVFFAWWTASTIAGLLAGILARGVINPAGEDGWFALLGNEDGFNRSAAPLLVALGVWVFTFGGSLWHFYSVDTMDQLGLTNIDGYHGYVGYWSAFLTGVVALLVAAMVAERWFTRSMFIGSMWVLYQVSSWFERGIWYNDNLDTSLAPWLWFAFTFFITVGIYYIGNHERYGGWANRGEHEPSNARLFLRNHGAGMMIAAAFLFGLAVRIQWYVVPSMNAFGTGAWDMTGGSDPWYMKRVVDYILANNAHLVYDADRFYPIGGINPRPPLFTWSIAVGAMLLEPFLGADAVWYSILGLPAVYGALTVFPIAAMARDQFGKGAAVFAAWLIAFMPAHVTHSTWGLADHDSFVMLFISLGFMFWLRSVRYAGTTRISRTTSPHPASFMAAYRDVAQHRQAALAYAVMAGVSFGIAALGWKGFVVGPAILFLAYALQVALNMFRRRDSTSLSVMFLTMLAVIFLMGLPFYGHPQLDLIFDSTGLQPFLFISVFTVAIAYVTTGFRDKPWLLVLGTLGVVALVFFTALFLLQFLNIWYGWDVLFSGSGYFAKNKIFGTIAEANAPQRAQLFASFGPITFLLALIVGGSMLWRGLRSRNSTALVFGVWVFAATFMSWNAARFMFNATPIMSVLGAAGIMSFWRWADWPGVVRSWKKMGIRTPADRISGARKAVWRTPQFSAVFLVMIMLFGQQATYGLDSAIPGTSAQEGEIDEQIYNIVPDILRYNALGFSILDSSPYESRNYLGSFGSSFNDNGWNTAYEWLAQQDLDESYSERPAFVSWWDYGFQALNTGQHPSVSDNFQSGIPATGNMLMARSQEDLTAMWIWQLSEADRTYASPDCEVNCFTDGFELVMQNHLTEDQFEDFFIIQTASAPSMIDFVLDHSFQVLKTNRDVVMAEGHPDVAGVFDDSQTVYRIYRDGAQLDCTADLSTTCLGSDFTSEIDANASFQNNIRTGADTVTEASYTIFGDYWYTADLLEEYDSASTSIHRTNARIAMTTQLLSKAFEANTEATIHDLYYDLIELDQYNVQDFNGMPGETVERNHEIRYLAIDDRLYPRAGRYTADANYNRGQPMGIFGAPTILSGQDVGTYMDEVYETVRGDFQDEMTREEVDEAMQQDILNQQAGVDIDPLFIEDVRVDHNPAFFDTMTARTYVGYGASTLGLSTGASNPQPAQHFGQSGTPGSILQQALPLPGAMMNHFVISNWYSEDATLGIPQTNTLVKILKYYPGAEMNGQVTMADNGEGLSNVRLLIERDAFSGEGETDLDEDTYWIPIGFTDTDENGFYSYTVPAGRIRVTAYAGDYSPTAAQDQIRDGSFAERIGDILEPTNDNREINQITAILGQVANMTWLGESQMNVTGDEADRISDLTEDLDVVIDSSGVSGTVSWSGDEAFNGDPIAETTFILRNIWSMTDNYTVTTTSGSFTSDESRILQGSGEATFTENGTFESEGIAVAQNFIGTYTRTIGADRAFFANGTWTGYGTIEASWIEGTPVDCDADNASEPVMPANETACVISTAGDLSIYKIEGTVNASGTYTSESTTTLVRTYGDVDAGTGETIEGAGSFAGTGTFNGTGLFIGTGSFSGPMVEPGSFYKTGLLPGTYNMIAQLDNGKEVLLPDPVEVGVVPSYDLAMTMPGAIFADTLMTLGGDVLANTTIELVDTALGEDFAVDILTDENGTFSHGPVAKGDYFYRVDVDNDGWYDVNETAIVIDDTSNITLAGAVPPTVDVTLQLVSPVDPLTQEPLFNVSGRTITFDNTLGVLEPVNATSDENGSVYVEVFFGVWDIMDEENPEYVLFDQIDVEVGVEDVELNVTYAQAAYINGSMRFYPGTAEEYATWTETPDENKIQTTEEASGLLVSLRTGVLEFEATTNITGDFSIRVPSGFDYDMTSLSATALRGYGSLVTVPTGSNMDLGTVYLEPLSPVEGVIYLYDNATVWDNTLPRWVAPVIVATGDGYEWRTEANEDGVFTFLLPDGEWTLSALEDDLNIEPVEDISVNLSATTSLSQMELVAMPEGVEVTLNMFLNSAEDQSFENGTKVSPDFILRPQAANREDLHFDAGNFTSDGNVTVTLTPGTYNLVFNRTTASAENATDYDLVGEIAFDQIYIALDGPEEPLPVPLRHTYRVNGTLTNTTGDGIANQFLLYNEADEQWFNVESDTNGSFSSYVPAGDWVVIVAPFLNENTTETLRVPLSVTADKSTRTNLTYQTVAAVDVSVQLLEDLTENELPDKSITAVSHDGYGNITLERTNSDGNTTEMMMPGDWSFYLNSTIGRTMWSLDTSATPTTVNNNGNGTFDAGVLHASLEVEIGGKVYWDLNDDDTPDATEGIPEFNVTVTGNTTTVNETVMTDADGVWRLFVPIRDDYNVTVMKEGFETVYYSEENASAYVVLDSPDSRDIEVSAGSVDVTGTVTDSVDANRLIDASITLYPVAGVERDAVVVIGTMNGSTLEWNALIQPGEWVVMVAEANPGFNGGGVAYGLLDATVANGGNISLVMALGGYVSLDTLWLDVNQGEHHAGSSDAGYDLIDEPVEIEVTYDEMSWMVTVPTNGTLDQLFPEGAVAYDSEFITTQHSTNLSMEYYGGQNVNVLSDTTISSVLQYNRRVNSDLVVELDADSIVPNALLVDEEDRHLMAIVSTSNASMFNDITVDVTVTYNGTETMDIFDVTGQMGLAQDSELWSVQVWNESSEEYEDSIEIALGVGDDDTSAVLSKTVTLQISLPDVEDAWHLEDAHRVTLRMETELGEATTLSLKLEVPQTFGLEVSQESDTLGIGALVERRFSVDVTNTGNGQDTFNVEIGSAVPDDWSITGGGDLTLAKGETRSSLFTAFAPESFTEGEFPLTIRVTSEDGNSTDEVTLDVQSARITLEVNQGAIATASDQYTKEEGSVRVPVQNTGFLDAPSVFVYLTDENTGDEMQMNIEVPANGNATAVFEGIEQEIQGNARYTVRIDVQGVEAEFLDAILVDGEVDDDGTFDFSIEYNPRTSSDGDSPWLTLVIVVLGALVIFGGLRTARSRSNNRF